MKNLQVRLVVVAMVLYSCMPVVQASGACDEKVAADLLSAILSRDVQALKKTANNPDVFDEQAIEYLLGDSRARFYGRVDLRSAHVVLNGKRVLKKITAVESGDGSRTIDVVYLPTSTTSDFVGLAKMAKAGRALPFRDYVMCSVVIKNGTTFMPHACYAETDALD